MLDIVSLVSDTFSRQMADHIGREDSGESAVNFLDHSGTTLRGLRLRLGYDRWLPRVYGAARGAFRFRSYGKVGR